MRSVTRRFRLRFVLRLQLRRRVQRDVHRERADLHEERLGPVSFDKALGEFGEVIAGPPRLVGGRRLPRAGDGVALALEGRAKPLLLRPETPAAEVPLAPEPSLSGR